MVLQLVPQQLLQEKKNILPTSFVGLSREDKMDCNRCIIDFQAVNIPKENKGLFCVSGADFIQQRGVGHEQRVVK